MSKDLKIVFMKISHVDDVGGWVEMAFRIETAIEYFWLSRSEIQVTENKNMIKL